jgi:hypothetical protein
MATPTTLPAAFTSGAVLTSTQMNNLRGAFRILQIVSGTTATQVSSSTLTYVDTTLSATITPQSNTSQILVYVNHPNCYRSATGVYNSLSLRLYRGATLLQTQTLLGENGAAVYNIFSTQMVQLDSPSSTSALTYKTQFANGSATAEVRVQTNSNPSQIILMEISA